MIFTKPRQEFEQFGLQNAKKYGGKIYLRTHIFRTRVHKSNIRVKRWHSKYELLKNIERHNFCLNYLPIKTIRTALQTYKVEERTFGTPCIWNESYMNCGNEMKMKKWSSQWTQFMQLRKKPSAGISQTNCYQGAHTQTRPQTRLTRPDQYLTHACAQPYHPYSCRKLF